MHSRSKRVLGAGLFAGLAYSLWRAWRRRVPEPSRDITWDTAPFPFPPIPRPTHDVPAPTPGPPPPGPTADPGADGECPISHPVKGKISSGIYHLPGGINYARTKPDRCYVDAAAAEADGLRPSKR